MEEANALANRAGIISRRILTIGTTDFLRQKHGNVYYVHLVLKTAPTSTVEEMQRVERWIESSVAGVRFDSFGNYHGQIKFSLPAGNNISEGEDEEENQPDQIEPVNGVGLDDSIIVSVHRRRRPKKSGVLALFSLLEANKQAMGLEFYSVGATTLDQVFLNVVAENDVREEGYAIPASSGKRTSGRWWCF
jgi:ATP-binding cassette, subfamily A (ABC1), member 3